MTGPLQLLGLQETRVNVALATLLGVVSFFLSAACVTLIVVRLPVDYFRSGSHGPAPLPRRIARNVLGLLLTVIGLLLSLPGIPGPGILTMLAGLVLVDFPGKRRVLGWLSTKPKVQASLNRTRARFRKPPLEF